MSGARLLLDTNAVVALLSGTSAVEEEVFAASFVGVSVIARLEFLAFSGLSQNDKDLFESFCRRAEVIGLTRDDLELQETAVRLRRDFGLKLPDAIIAATALTQKAVLVTADEDFNRVKDLKVVHPNRPAEAHRK